MADVRYHAQPTSVSPISAVLRWLRLKKYQYEVTFSLYMLTSTEKLVFNTILFILISLLVTAAYAYLPGHILVIYGRVSYYISGEFTADHNARLMDSLGHALKTSKEVLISQTATAAIAKETVGRARQVAQALQDEL